MDVMTKEESYVDRRQLFKNIWDTAMLIDDRGTENIMAKTKVIKTLRLDEVDKCIDKRKKEKIKNLRSVCRKILDFCDRQDADDLNIDQNADVEDRTHHLGLKRIKTRHRRRKVKKNKSLLVLKKFSVFDRTDIPSVLPKNESRYNSPASGKGPTIVQRALITHRKTIKIKSSTGAEGTNAPSKGSATRRKVISKRPNKRKKTTTQKFSPPGPSGILDCPHP